VNLKNIAVRVLMCMSVLFTSVYVALRPASAAGQFNCCSCTSTCTCLDPTKKCADGNGNTCSQQSPSYTTCCTANSQYSCYAS